MVAMSRLNKVYILSYFLHHCLSFNFDSARFCLEILSLHFRELLWVIVPRFMCARISIMEI